MNNKNINRKDFFKVLGTATATSAALAYGCKPRKDKTSESVAVTLDDIQADKLTYRTNPHTHDTVSLLGYGCMRLPMTQITETEDEVDQETWNELVDAAISKGVNYFDTAPVYTGGRSEYATGLALSRHPRDKYYIATKMSNFRPDTWTREGSLEIYHNSFKQLQVDYIDYYLLHAVGMGGMRNFNARYIDNGMLDFLLEERKKGKIRNLGFSFHGDVEVYDYLLSMDIQWDFAQIQLNYVDWKHASGSNINADYLYSELVKHNVPAIVMEPLLGGRLVRLNHESASLLKQAEPQSSLASWAFRFAGSPDKVLTVLSGMTYKEHLIDNLHTYSPLRPLTEKDYTMLEKAAEYFLSYPLIPCNDCGYCMPCPYGIDIPGVLLHYNKCIREGNFATSSNDPEYNKARNAFLVGYDRSVPKLRQADHCTGCDQCTPKCPQRIHIPQQMRRIDTYVEHLKQGTEFTEI